MSASGIVKEKTYCVCGSVWKYTVFDGAEIGAMVICDGSVVSGSRIESANASDKRLFDPVSWASAILNHSFVWLFAVASGSTRVNVSNYRICRLPIGKSWRNSVSCPSARSTVNVLMSARPYHCILVAISNGKLIVYSSVFLQAIVNKIGTVCSVSLLVESGNCVLVVRGTANHVVVGIQNEELVFWAPANGSRKMSDFACSVAVENHEPGDLWLSVKESENVNSRALNVVGAESGTAIVTDHHLP